MKNYLDQLATELYLRVVVDGKPHYAGLNDALSFDVDQNVVIEDIEVLPRFYYLADNGVLAIDEPFYIWHHRVSHQGWLLTPR